MNKRRSLKYRFTWKILEIHEKFMKNEKVREIHEISIINSWNMHEKRKMFLKFMKYAWKVLEIHEKYMKSSWNSWNMYEKILEITEFNVLYEIQGNNTTRLNQI